MSFEFCDVMYVLLSFRMGGGIKFFLNCKMFNFKNSGDLELCVFFDMLFKNEVYLVEDVGEGGNGDFYKFVSSKFLCVDNMFKFCVDFFKVVLYLVVFIIGLFW